MTPTSDAGGSDAPPPLEPVATAAAQPTAEPLPEELPAAPAGAAHSSNLPA